MPPSPYELLLNILKYKFNIKTKNLWSKLYYIQNSKTRRANSVDLGSGSVQFEETSGTHCLKFNYFLF